MMLDRLRHDWPHRPTRWNLLWWYASRAWTHWLSRDFGSVGEQSLFVLPCWFHGTERITIGDRVQIGPMCRIGALFGTSIAIGDECEIVGGCSFFSHAEGIEIGKAVLMAWNVQIYDAQHETKAGDAPIRQQGVSRAGKVRIGDGAWLGANVVVLPGVTIGRNAVVGANSVVTKDVPDFATAVGAPAAVVSTEAHSRALHE